MTRQVLLQARRNLNHMLPLNFEASLTYLHEVLMRLFYMFNSDLFAML